MKTKKMSNWIKCKKYKELKWIKWARDDTGQQVSREFKRRAKDGKQDKTLLYEYFGWAKDYEKEMDLSKCEDNT